MKHPLQKGDIVKFKCRAVRGEFMITKIKGLCIYLKNLSTGISMGRHYACDLEIVESNTERLR